MLWQWVGDWMAVWFKYILTQDAALRLADGALQRFKKTDQIQDNPVISFQTHDPCLTSVPLLSLKTLDTKPVYSEEELQRFEAELRDKEEELKRKAENLRQEQELLKERGKALEAQRREYQQVSVAPWILWH